MKTHPEERMLTCRGAVLLALALRSMAAPSSLFVVLGPPRAVFPAPGACVWEGHRRLVLRGACRQGRSKLVLGMVDIYDDDDEICNRKPVLKRLECAARLDLYAVPVLISKASCAPQEQEGLPRRKGREDLRVAARRPEERRKEPQGKSGAVSWSAYLRPVYSLHPRTDMFRRTRSIEKGNGRTWRGARLT